VKPKNFMEEYVSFFDENEEINFLSRKREKDNDYSVQEEEIGVDPIKEESVNEETSLNNSLIKDEKEMINVVPKELKEKYNLKTQIKSINVRFNTNSEIDIKGLAKNNNKNITKFSLKPTVLNLTFKSPSCYVSIYRKGVINGIAIKNEECCDKLLTELNKLIFYRKAKEKLKEFKITNLMGYINIGFKINLYKLGENELFIFNPEIYNDVAVYVSDSPPITLRIYKKGVINFLGARSKESINMVIDKIYIILKENECKD
jgi:TATA-box binding protein (TBP) (component of TFIID and TFIIIB)